MISFLSLLKSNKYVQMALALLVGALMGAYMNSGASEEKVKETVKQQYELQISELNKQHSAEVSSLQQSLTSEQQKTKEVQMTSSKKLSKLLTENSNLKKSSKRSTYKLVKPDGTIIEKEYDENSSEASKQASLQIKQEFDQKLKSVEQTWKKVHEEKVAELKKQFDSDLEKARTEIQSKEVVKEKEITKLKQVNHLAVEYDTTKKMDVNYTRDVLGPLFLDGGASIDSVTRAVKPYAGIGVGVSF